MPLTDLAMKNAKPKEKPYKLYDTDGLYAIINPNGGKWWRVKYYFQSKEKLLSLGTYPQISLLSARKRRDEIKGMVAQGIDPSAHKKEAKAASAEEQRVKAATFEAIARE